MKMIDQLISQRDEIVRRGGKLGEDLFDELCVTVLKRPTESPAMADSKFWRMVKNKKIDIWRRERRHLATRHELNTIAPEDPRTLHDIEQFIADQEFADRTRFLNPLDQVVLRRRVEGASISEIAIEFCTSVKAVNSRLQRVRAALRPFFEKPAVLSQGSSAGLQTHRGNQ